MSESRPHADPDSADPDSGEETYLLSETGLNSPLNELRLIFEKRHRTATNLGEEDKARLYQEAWELSHKRLAAFLGEEG
jgi:hypothetical protein